jgi:DNA adenine methylase
LEFGRYIEVFGGAAWVLFHKRPGPFEVYNDFNSLLANLFRCVRDRPEELKNALRYVLNSREDFKIILDLFARDAVIDSLDKAAKFYQLIRFSYAAGIDSYSCQPHDLWSDFPAIDAANYRLREVIVENKDFAALIRHYDRPESFFYLDPPYFGTEKHYQNTNFTRESHQRLFDTLMGVEGRWLLSYGDEPPIRELYGVPGVFMMPVSRLSNIKQRYEGGSEFPELLIANYDILERSRQPEQLMLA